MQNRSNNGGFVPAFANWDLGPLEDPTINLGCGRAFSQQSSAQNGRGQCASAQSGRSQQTQQTRAAQNCRGTLRGVVRQAGAGSAANRCTGQADCACEACARKRSASAASASACAAPAAPEAPACTVPVGPVCPVPVTPVVPVCPAPAAPCTSCPLGQSAASLNANGGVGMVYAVSQTLTDIYDAHSALAAGTLYPELLKPLDGYCPTGENCAASQQEASFVLWELRLYLDTHPNDERALALWRKLAAQADESYATAFLPDCRANWTWVNGPWPWDVDANRC